MTLQELQWAVQILVGGAVLCGTLVGVGKGWATLAQSRAMLKALHERLDKFNLTQQELSLDIREIKTFLRVHPTLRFRIPERPIPAAPAGLQEQDIFAPGDRE